MMPCKELSNCAHRGCHIILGNRRRLTTLREGADTLCNMLYSAQVCVPNFCVTGKYAQELSGCFHGGGVTHLGE